MSILDVLMKSPANERPSAPQSSCPLCTSDGGKLIWRGAFWRLVSVDEPGYPGFLRLIVNRHVAELSELALPEQQQLFKLLIAIETRMRELLSPEKINIASLGNHVPHQHWHIIPRWSDDPCFPASIWTAPAQPPKASPALATRQANAEQLFAELPTLCTQTVY
jgi:diadenosine tetraphosphate (Ap4A) HIT family hydrolase